MTGGDFRQAALSGARWMLASKIGLQLFTWPVTILVIRLLEPGDYGLLAMAMVTISFVALFSEMGLGMALVQAEKLDDATARSACAAIIACNVALAGVLALLAPLAALWFGEPAVVPVMRTLTLELLISALAAVPQAQLERRLRFRQLSIASIAGGAVGATLTLVLAFLDFDVWALVFGNLGNALVRSALLVFFNGAMVWPSLRHGLAPVRGLIRFSAQVLAARFLWTWFGQADQLVLARLLHASLLGAYNVAAQLAMLPANKAMEIINRVAFPILSRMGSQRADLQAMHARLLALVATYAFGACWGLAALAPELVTTLFGDKWHAATLPLTLLAAVAPLRMLSALNNTVTSAAGVPKASTQELAVASVLLPVAVLAGALLDGLRGACLAWPLAYPLVYLLSNALTCQVVASPQRRALLPLVPAMMAGALMWLFIWVLRGQLAGYLPAGASLVVELLTGAVSYAVALRLLAPALAHDVRVLTTDLLRPARPTADAAGAPRQGSLPG